MSSLLGSQDATDWGWTSTSSSPDAIARAVATIAATDREVDAIWVLTRSGSSARLVAHYRPKIPIIAFTLGKPLLEKDGTINGAFDT